MQNSNGKIVIMNFKKLIQKLLDTYLRLFQKFMILRRHYIMGIKKYFINNLNEIKYNVLTPAFKIEFTKEEKTFLNEEIRCSKEIKKAALTGYIQKESFTCCFNNIKFIGASGGILYNNRGIVESAFNFSRFSRVRMIDNFILKHRRMKGAYSSIIHYSRPYNHYHWLIDNIPRLYGLMKIEEPEIKLIVPSDINLLELNTLNAILDDRFKFVPIQQNEVWKIENFYFPSFCNDNCSGYMPKVYLDFVRKKITEGFAIKSTNLDKRVYISRDLAIKKRVLNENKLVSLLNKYDFKRVFAEKLSFKEQVEVFNTAKIIISPIGAGLSNIIFSDNLKVIELMPPRFFGTHYFMLCKALGFKWDYIIGDYKDQNKNFKINLNSVEEKINKMI